MNTMIDVDVTSDGMKLMKDGKWEAFVGRVDHGICVMVCMRREDRDCTPKAIRKDQRTMRRLLRDARVGVDEVMAAVAAQMEVAE